MRGDVTLDDAGAALTALRELIDGLVAEVAPNTSITWIIDQLSSGSLAAEIVGQSNDQAAVERVAEAYGQVGTALSRREPIPFKRARGPARRLVNLINGRIEEIYFEAENVYAPVTESEAAPPEAPTSIESIGTVSGTLRTLSSAQGIRVWVFDDAAGHSVRCRLTEGQSELARDLWGKQVIVEGVVRRSLLDGRPLSVTRVRSLSESSPVAPGSWRDTVGVLPRDEDQPRAEEVIRRMRDAE